MTGLTTQALAARVRSSPMVDPKRTISVRELEAWLETLAGRGYVERVDGEWLPTPLGDVWLREFRTILPEPAVVAA